MGRGFILSVLVNFDFEVVETELQRGRGRRDDKKKFGICNLQLVTCGFGYSAVLLSAAGRMGGEEMGRLTVSGQRGADRGDEPREAL